MAKPPVSVHIADRGNSLQFSHFGVMNTGHQDAGAFVTSLTANLVLAFVVCVLGAASVKHTMDHPTRVTFLTAPIEPLKPVPVKQPPPPKILPKPPVIRAEVPKITVPEVKPLVAPKPTVVAMTHPAPAVVPAPPKAVSAPAAPRVVSLAHPMAASVVNNSSHPTAVALGRVDNPMTPSDRPATSAVDLGQRGLSGMPASNTGGGPRSAKVNLGSGSPQSQSLTGTGVRPVQGVKLGVPGGTGPLNSPGRQVGQVNLGRVEPPAALSSAGPTTVSLGSVPKVLYKPTPAYTPEATALHISGAVSLRIRVSATGSVSVLQLMNGLGHGLDESAKVAVQQTRFAPARDSSGQPTDWEGMVLVNFQMVGS
jgi:TonB family protein